MNTDKPKAAEPQPQRSGCKLQVGEEKGSDQPRPQRLGLKSKFPVQPKPLMPTFFSFSVAHRVSVVKHRVRPTKGCRLTEGPR